MYIRFGRKFEKQYNKAPNKIKRAFDLRLELFIASPFHPLLDNHALIGNWSGYRSINITGDWRGLFTENFSDNGEKVIIFHIIGTHSQIYK